MAINQTFPLPPSPVVTYSFTDIAEGTGVQIFYAFTSESSTGVDQHLTTQSDVYSAIVETRIVTGSVSVAEKVIDMDFDLSPFNLSQDIEGTGLILNTISAGTSSGQTDTNFFIYKLRKWDGSTETEIASVQSPSVSTAGSVVNELVTIPFTIPRTHFSKGDVLRLTCEGWTASTSTDTTIIAFGHDPRNRDGTNISPSTDDPATITQLILHIPFRIDI